MRTLHLLVMAVATLMVSLPNVALAQVRQPELIPGKSTLFQRILTRPAADLVEQPGGGVIETFPAFEIFYVYGQQEAEGETYLEVGRSLSAGPEGWMRQERTIPWRQAIVLGFNNPANRDRAMMFDTRENLEETLLREDVVERLAALRADAEGGEASEDSPVVAVEPAQFVNIEEQFYILPILASEEIRMPTTGMPAQILQVASLSANEPDVELPPVDPEKALEDFKIGVTFVIDTTRSMGPYIDETRTAVEQLQKDFLAGPEGDRFRFGLVAFRDNVELAPGLEYVARTYLKLDVDSTADKFLEAIEQVVPAEANSASYNEDAVAGVVEAVENHNWEPFGGRYIILITDAGPRRPGPEAAAGMLALPELQVQAEEGSGIAIFTMHLKSESGAFDHEYGEESYRVLSRFGGQSLYYPVEDGSAEQFGRQVAALSQMMTGQITDAISGRLAAADEAEPGSMEQSLDMVGRAMQLAYLGRVTGTAAPEVFEGWLTDRDPLERHVRPVQPYIMMSKNELATLRDVLLQTIEIGSDTSQDINSTAFFERLREAVALMSNRPDAVNETGTLGDLMGEYLEDLPYTSEILDITPERWRDLSVIEEHDLLEALESKVEAIEHLHDDNSRWIALVEGAPEGEYVTNVPLSLMP